MTGLPRYSALIHARPTSKKLQCVWRMFVRSNDVAEKHLPYRLLAVVVKHDKYPLKYFYQHPTPINSHSVIIFILI